MAAFKIYGLPLVLNFNNMRNHNFPLLMYFFSATAILLQSINGFAQINESDTTKIQIRASFSGNTQKGNIDVLTLRSRLELTYAPVKSLVFKSQNSSLYQAFYKVKADNDVFSRNYLYFQPQHKAYPFAIAYISSNYRRKINLRYFTGLGLTWQVVNRPNLVLKASASTVYENTQFDGVVYNYPEFDGNKKIQVWRGTLYTGGWAYLTHHKIRLFYDAYWQPAFNNPNNYRTQYDLGVDFSIWKGLSFNTLYTFTHENVVVQKIKPEDKILTFGIAYNLKAKHRS